MYARSSSATPTFERQTEQTHPHLYSQHLKFTLAANMSVASSGGHSEDRRQAELELDELERRRHSNKHFLPAPSHRTAHPAEPASQEWVHGHGELEAREGTAALISDTEYDKENPIGLYGWRKRCLYFFVLLLVVVVITNLALTIWMLVVLNFSQHGMGNLRILDSGIRLEGTAQFLGPLFAQNISADQNSSLLLQSQTSINLNIEGGADVAMDNSSLNITAQLFQVATPTNSSPAISITDDGIIVGASQMEVQGTLGMILNGPLETDEISSHPSADLNIESASGSLMMVGRGGVSIQDGPAFDGVQVTSNEGLSITSHTEVVLDSATVRLSGLPRVDSGRQQTGVYEVCACASGKLYLSLALASGPACSTNTDTCSTS